MRRPVLPGDISDMARALLAQPEAQRAAVCDQIFVGAAQAVRYVERRSRLHPVWGDGTLSAAARRFTLACEPGYDHVEYLRCTLCVLDALRGRLSGQRGGLAPATGGAPARP